ncbi:MAG: phage major tail tube protein [Alphaproteobacteria bacterium]|nr:phage major tail tube protein [Alphaproteobacteria bacterium]
MAIPKKLKNFTLFVDGRNLAGKVMEATLPKLTVKTEEYRGGGMDAPIDIDMGMEKLELDFTLHEYDPDVADKFGLVIGNSVIVTLRGAQQSDTNTAEAVEVQGTGFIKELDFGSWKPGEAGTLKVMMNLRRYRLAIASREIIVIDVENMIRIINGVDVIAGQRGALGI